MDYLVIAAGSVTLAYEANNFRACADEAARNGVSERDAELCDASKGCKACPFRTLRQGLRNENA